jgi:hypothetical protein
MNMPERLHTIFVSITLRKRRLRSGSNKAVAAGAGSSFSGLSGAGKRKQHRQAGGQQHGLTARLRPKSRSAVRRAGSAVNNQAHGAEHTVYVSMKNISRTE